MTVEEKGTTLLPTYQRDFQRVLHPNESYYGFGLGELELGDVIFDLAHIIAQEWRRENERGDGTAQPYRYARVYGNVTRTIGGQEFAKNVWRCAALWSRIQTDDPIKCAGRLVIEHYATRPILMGAHRVIKHNPEFFFGNSKYSQFDPETAQRLERCFSVLSKEQFMEEMSLFGLSEIDEVLKRLLRGKKLDQFPMVLNTSVFSHGKQTLSNITGIRTSWIHSGTHRDIVLWAMQYKAKEGVLPTADQAPAGLGLKTKEALQHGQMLIDGKLPIRAVELGAPEHNVT